MRVLNVGYMSKFSISSVFFRSDCRARKYHCIAMQYSAVQLQLQLQLQSQSQSQSQCNAMQCNAMQCNAEQNHKITKSQNHKITKSQKHKKSRNWVYNILIIQKIGRASCR